MTSALYRETIENQIDRQISMDPRTCDSAALYLDVDSKDQFCIIVDRNLTFSCSETTSPHLFSKYKQIHPHPPLSRRERLSLDKGR